MKPLPQPVPALCSQALNSLRTETKLSPISRFSSRETVVSELIYLGKDSYFPRPGNYRLDYFPRHIHLGCALVNMLARKIPRPWENYIKVALCACLFATYRPHAFLGAALRDRLSRGPPCGRKWTCETRAEEGLKPHTLSVLQLSTKMSCSMQKVEEMFAFTFSRTACLSCY